MIIFAFSNAPGQRIDRESGGFVFMERRGRRAQERLRKKSGEAKGRTR